MAVAENGRPVENRKATTNGTTDKDKAAGVSKQPLSPTLDLASQKQSTIDREATSWTRWLISATARLALWYALFTIIFVCPSDPAQLQVDTSRPQICKPYLTLRVYVEPHVQPYYDTYASPYVEQARPYVEEANIRVVAPAVAIVKKNFDTYAAPHLNTARVYGHHQWDTVVRPQLAQAQAQAADLYQANLAPHVSKASELSQPYYTAAIEAADKLRKNHILPAYQLSQPHVANAINSSHHFVFYQASPLLHHGWISVQTYVDSHVWPFVKGLYIDNVRPQLVMISERIAEYQESRKTRVAINDDGENVHVPEPSAESGVPAASRSASALDDLFALGEEDSSSLASSASSAAPSSSVQPQVREVVYATDESTSEDLRKWQEKFALAADKGTDELKARVSEIASSLVQSDIEGLGKPLASALKLTAEQETSSVKTKIKSVAASLSKDASAEEVASAESEVIKAVRTSGLAVKERAIEVREWAKKFEAQLNQQVNAATDSTLEVLDGIRDLGLQEVGMRWAWSEGVTYKHWAKYHELRKTLDTWRQEVHETALQNEYAVGARATAREILEDTMAHTEEAAKLLIKLREAAKWKIRARDESDDFEPREIPPVPISDALNMAEETPGTTSSAERAESESTLSDEVLDGASSSVTESTATSVADEAADFISPGSDETAIEPSKEPIPEASEEAVVKASEHAFTETAQYVATDTPERATSDASEDASLDGSTVKVSPATHAQKAPSFIPGAEAQEVKGSGPILDDHFDDNSDATLSENIQSLIQDTGDRYAEVTRAASEALFGAQQNTGESVTSILADKYSSALAAASSVILDGSHDGHQTVDATQYDKAVTAARDAVYGAPTATLEALVNQASSSYSEAIRQAEQHYEDAKSIASAQISHTTKPIHEEIFSSIESAFAGAQAAASSRLHAAVSAASAQYLSPSSQAIPTQGSLDFISSIAASRLHAALHEASVHYSHAKSVDGGDEHLGAAQQKYITALDHAQAEYSDFVSLASNAVHETLGAAYSSVSSAASENWQSLVSAASAKVYGSSIPASREDSSQAAEDIIADDTPSAVSSLASEADQSFSVSAQSAASTESAVSESAASTSVEESGDTSSSVASSESTGASTKSVELVASETAASASIEEADDVTSSYASSDSSVSPTGSFELVTSAATDSKPAASISPEGAREITSSASSGSSVTPTESVESIASDVTDSSQSTTSTLTEEPESAYSTTESQDDPVNSSAPESVDENESATEGAQSNLSGKVSSTASIAGKATSSATEYTKDEL
ncbi:hypothetical protein DV738_g5301, partial [Chaetothyriales sp. CBS 135597]